MPLGDVSEIRKRRNSIFDLASWLAGQQDGFVLAWVRSTHEIKENATSR